MLALARLSAWGGGVDPTQALGSRRSWAARHGLLLSVEDDAGRRGLGEASPLPGLSDETVTEARAALEAVPWARIDPRALAEGTASAELAHAPPSARFAIETACADLVGQEDGRPAYRVLGGEAEPGPVPVNALVGHVRDPDLVGRAAAAVRSGAAALKVKLEGRDLASELSALRAARDAVGAAVRLRVDLGGALRADAAARWLDALAAVGVEAVEEPCGGAALLSLESGAVPWLADETLQDRSLRDRLIEARGCRGLVLKPTLLGGLHACLEIARRGHLHDKSVTITHAFEGPVARSACAALALAARAGLAGLDEHAGLEAFPPMACAALPRDPPLAVHPCAAPGLGLSVGAALDHLTWSGLWRR